VVSLPTSFFFFFSFLALCPRIQCGGAPLAKDSFRYLGMFFFYRTHLLSICLVLSWLVVTRIRQFAREHHLIDRPHAFLWLAKCYAVPSMYACQIWGTHFMKKGSELDSPLQTAHMCFLKGVLCVKRTKPNWAVLQECGQEPLQFYCIRAAAKFLNSLLNGKSACSRRLCIQILLSMLLTKIARLRSS